MTEQLAEAGMLLAIGMIVVFSFLTLLIVGIHCIAWFAKVFPEPEASNLYNKLSYNKNNNKSATITTVNPKIVAAITAGVSEYRRNGK